MFKEIVRMNGKKIKIPFYYIKYTKHGEVVCQEDDNEPKTAWAVFIDSYEDLVSITVRKPQVDLLIDVLNNPYIRDIKIVNDLRKTLLVNLGRDIFEGSPNE